MNSNKLWKAEDVIKVITTVRGVDGRTKSLIIRHLTAKCHDTGYVTEGVSAMPKTSEKVWNI